MALESERGLFCSTYDAEAGMTPEEWRDLIAVPDGAIFGAFDGDVPVAITAVFSSREDPTAQTAVLAMSFVLPAYRGRGLAHAFYEARLAWVRGFRRFKRVVVSHRASNEPSRRANQRFGFALAERRSRTWPDGGTEDELVYELRL